MKQNKFKAIILAGLLLLPVVIFLFLKSFGSNQFNVPIYYELGVTDSLPDECGRNKEIPYRVFTKPASAVLLKVYHFEKQPTNELGFRLEELERVQDVFQENNGVKIFSFLNHPSITIKAIEKFADRVNVNKAFWSVRPVDSLTYDVFKNCELVMNDEDSRVVLVDTEERIRGYYDISDREETDRLILELKILLSQDK